MEESNEMTTKCQIISVFTKSYAAEILKDRIIYEDIFLSNILTQDVSIRILNSQVEVMNTCLNLHMFSTLGQAYRTSLRQNKLKQFKIY